MRRMVRETRLSPDRLILPAFAIEGRDARVPIPSLPGHSRMSPDLVAETARRAFAAGVPAMLLFGVTDHKDAAASAAYEPGGVVQTAVAAIKDAVPGDGRDHRRLPLRVHRPRPLRRAGRRARRQRP